MLSLVATTTALLLSRPCLLQALVLLLWRMKVVHSLLISQLGGWMEGKKQAGKQGKHRQME